MRLVITINTGRAGSLRQRVEFHMGLAEVGRSLLAKWLILCCGCLWPIMLAEAAHSQKALSAADHGITGTVIGSQAGTDEDSQLARHSEGAAIGNYELVTDPAVCVPVQEGRMSSIEDLESTFQPAYKVVGILYSMPGNQSNQLFGVRETTGTTTTVGDSFTFGNVSSFQNREMPPIPIRGSGSIGNQTLPGRASTFTQTFTGVVPTVALDNSYFVQSYPTSNAVNHNFDRFIIWLNPRVTVWLSGKQTACYSVSAQPISENGMREEAIADIVQVPANVMEAAPVGYTSLNPSVNPGVSTVPVDILSPQLVTQADGRRIYMPGLGAICRNNGLYLQQFAEDVANPDQPLAICTQRNQCGCTPADFSDILLTDPLLNYDSSTYSSQPYPGTVNPLHVDDLPSSSGPGSGSAICGQNVVPAIANCRYVVVPQAGMTTSESGEDTAVPTHLRLDGQNQVSTVVTDSTVTAGILSGKMIDIERVTNAEGPLTAKLSTPGHWAWTELERVGNPFGTPNAMVLSLQTSTSACTEDVNLYEDTIYHTFVYQVTKDTSGCAAPQSVQFPAPSSPVALGGPPIALSAIASSGLPVTFQIVSGPGTLDANLLTITGTGTIIVAATQAGDCSYKPAVPVTQSIVVVPAAPTFSLLVIPKNPKQTALSLGHSATYTVTVAAHNGFAGAVWLTLSGLPTGVSYRFAPPVISSSGTSVLTLSSAYSSSTYIGYSTLAITGISNDLTVSTQLTLITRKIQYRSACRVQ